MRVWKPLSLCLVLAFTLVASTHATPAAASCPVKSPLIPTLQACSNFLCFGTGPCHCSSGAQGVCSANHCVL